MIRTDGKPTIAMREADAILARKKDAKRRQLQTAEQRREIEQMLRAKVLV